MAQTIIFIHIPKTAGTTLVGIGSQQYKPEELFPIAGGLHSAKERLENLSQKERDNLRFVHGHHYYGWHEMFSDARYITILRNPIDRIISHFSFSRRTPKNRFYKLIQEQKLDLLGYIEATRLVELNNGQVRMLYGKHHHLEFGTNDPEILETALRHIEERFVLVGVQDRFPQMLSKLETRLGWQVADYESHLVAPNRIQEEEVDIETIDYIRELNQLDFALYERFAGNNKD